MSHYLLARGGCIDCCWPFLEFPFWKNLQVIDYIQSLGAKAVRGNQDDKALAEWLLWKSGAPLVRSHKVFDPDACACCSCHPASVPVNNPQSCHTQVSCQAIRASSRGWASRTGSLQLNYHHTWTRYVRCLSQTQAVTLCGCPIWDVCPCPSEPWPESSPHKIWGSTLAASISCCDPVQTSHPWLESLTDDHARWLGQLPFSLALPSRDVLIVHAGESYHLCPICSEPDLYCESQSNILLCTIFCQFCEGVCQLHDSFIYCFT